jgi:hypothetical protein
MNRRRKSSKAAMADDQVGSTPSLALRARNHSKRGGMPSFLMAGATRGDRKKAAWSNHFAANPHGGSSDFGASIEVGQHASPTNCR